MTKDNIIIAALRLFLLRGYKNVSLVDVAHEAGITKGGVYHYFASKEELLSQAIHFLFAVIEAKYKRLFNREGSLEDILKTIIVEREIEVYTQELLGICQGDYRLNYAGFALEVMHNFPDLKKRLDASHMVLCSVIKHRLETAIKAGEVRRDLDILTLAAIILSLLHGQNSLGTELNTPEMRQQMMVNIWKLIAV